MTANLTPDYRAAEERFRAATTPEEKLAALEDMLATIPKHKGTEKMQADLKRRIAKFREEGQRKSGARKRPFYMVEKQGAGQIVMVGPPNVGKSQILASLSNAEPDVAPYPFTTRTPLAGMVTFENIQIQLVDLPALAPEGSPPWLSQAIRAAGALMLVMDLSDDNVLNHFDTTVSLLGDCRVVPAGPSPGELYQVKNSILAANKLDAPGAAGRLELLIESSKASCPLPIIAVSALMGTGLETLKKAMVDVLGVIRVYTKAPGKTADFSAPFVLKKGTTVLEAAEVIHKDIARNLKSARLWSKRTFDGQMVQRDFVLDEGDIIEFHA